MNLIGSAMRRPITVLVTVLAVALFAILAIKRMAVDIFPNFGLPVIYVAQPYGGMDPAQMEGYLTSYYEYHFLYINGIEHVESKSIQGVSLIKLFFHPGTDMSQALAQTVSYVNRSKAFMPPGTVDPFIMRFDVGGVPVGQLVFSSETRGLGEIQDLALFRVRPMFATLQGVSAPPPFGGNQRTVVIRVDPTRLQAYQMSPEEVFKAISTGNAIMPAGTVRTGDLARVTPVNSVVTQIQELNNLPLRKGPGPTVFLRDIGTVENGSDILTGYALVNGKRAVYIPVTKRADASTLSVVNLVKQSLSRFQAAVPQDIKITLEFDQSVYVRNALRTLTTEGILGAMLTALMVLLFLRSWRSSLIVIITIPLALLTGVVALWLAGQTINIMTLGGLALAIGILVDEATVSIENIHTHLARGKTKARAVLDASTETILPRLLAMLCVVAVFAPSFLMVGVGRALFVPLSMAVGFSMIASYFLSSTLVPVLSTWLLREKDEANRGLSLFDRIRNNYVGALAFVLRFRWVVVGVYIVLAAGITALVGRWIGTEIFPHVESGLLQFRLRAPVGTRVERTELMALKALQVIGEEVGPANVLITSGFVGVQPSSYPINTIFLWTSGPHEAVLLVALNPKARISTEALKDRLRARMSQALTQVKLSFEPGDLVSQVMSFGSPTPVEIAITGPNLSADRVYAERVLEALGHVSSLRDQQIGQPLDYPTIDVNINRERAGQLGVTVQEVARSLVAATSSSRFVQPNYWRDPASGVAYQVQVEIPQSRIASIEDVESIPAMPSGQSRPLIGDVAQVRFGTMVGEYDRYNMQRMVTVTANTAAADLGGTSSQIEAVLRKLGDPPRGVTVAVRGQIAPLRQTLEGLQTGLLLSILVIFLLLAANFQSLWLSFVVVSTVPAVIAGVAASLFLTGTTLNVQSFMGAIMAVGVAVANAILLVTFSEDRRRTGMTAEASALEGGRNRLRPILMTSVAMVAGMVPMALGVGEGGEQMAPLGRAVIGGLLASTLASLAVLPCVFLMVQGHRSIRSASLDPDDPESAYAEKGSF